MSPVLCRVGHEKPACLISLGLKLNFLSPKLAQQVHASRRTCGRVLKALKFKPYRVTVVQQLRKPNQGHRVNFCQWLLNMIAEGLLEPLMFMTDEEWFHLSGYVNSQNSRYWATENPHQLQEHPLHQRFSTFFLLAAHF
jgi:hypothetical protein